MKELPTVRQLCRSMLAGSIAGLIASAAMTRFHVALSGPGLTGGIEPQSKKPVEGRDDATMKAADEVAEPVLGRHLTQEEKKEVGGPAMHYAFGAVAGATYGLLAVTRPNHVILRGPVFGAALWGVADQLALPLLGLSPWPWRAYPPSTNLQHVASHVVYGTTLAAVYALTRQAPERIDPPRMLHAAPY